MEQDRAEKKRRQGRFQGPEGWGGLEEKPCILRPENSCGEPPADRGLGWPCHCPGAGREHRVCGPSQSSSPTSVGALRSCWGTLMPTWNCRAGSPGSFWRRGLHSGNWELPADLSFATSEIEGQCCQGSPGSSTCDSGPGCLRSNWGLCSPFKNKFTPLLNNCSFFPLKLVDVHRRHTKRIYTRVCVLHTLASSTMWTRVFTPSRYLGISSASLLKTALSPR